MRSLAAVLVAGCAARGAPAPVMPEVFRLAAEIEHHVAERLANFRRLRGAP